MQKSKIWGSNVLTFTCITAVRPDKNFIYQLSNPAHQPASVKGFAQLQSKDVLTVKIYFYKSQRLLS